MKRRRTMKRKLIILLALTVATVGITACGKTETTETEPTEVVETTEVVTEDTETELVENTESTSTSSDGNDGSTTVATTTTIKESESWPEYKETMEYYIDNGTIDEARAYMLNPDVYGTVTYGKGTDDFDTGSGNPDNPNYVKGLTITTTKGYNIKAYYYIETGTVQFIYCGEVSPAGGSWWIDEASMDALNEGYDQARVMDLTHQQKIDLLGEPSMTAEEVIAALGY
jgi:hypothetical protein